MSADRDPTPCSACRLQKWLCVCAHAPRVATRTPLLLIVHVRDLGKTSNTVRLLTLAIREATVLCHGASPTPTDPASHVPAGLTPGPVPLLISISQSHSNVVKIMVE